MAAVTFSDFRAYSTDQKRDRDNKHKWACGVRGSPGHFRPRKQIKKRHLNHKEWIKFQEHQSPEEEMTDPIFSDPARQFLQDLPSVHSQPKFSDPAVGFFNTVTPTPFLPVVLGSLLVETGRETEKLVKSEYVILDEQGDAANGKKKLHILRRAERASLDIDGFEFV